MKNQVAKKIKNVYELNHKLVIAAYSAENIFFKKLILKNKESLRFIDFNSIFCTCCYSGNLKLAKYLVCSRLIKIDINYQENLSFKYACEKNNCDVIKYLILDLKINKNKNIEYFLNNNPNKIAESFFLLRSLRNHKKNNKSFIKI